MAVWPADTSFISERRTHTYNRVYLHTYTQTHVIIANGIISLKAMYLHEQTVLNTYLWSTHIISDIWVYIYPYTYILQYSYILIECNTHGVTSIFSSLTNFTAKINGKVIPTYDFLHKLFTGRSRNKL